MTRAPTPRQECRHGRTGHAPGIGDYCLDCDAADGLEGEPPIVHSAAPTPRSCCVPYIEAMKTLGNLAGDMKRQSDAAIDDAVAMRKHVRALLDCLSGKVRKRDVHGVVTEAQRTLEARR